MVIKNAVGGWLHIMELGIKLGPNQTVDLDFFCSRDDQKASKELSRAISRKYVTVENSVNVLHQTMYVNSITPSLTKKATGPFRKAVFLRTDIPIDPPHDIFVLRDTPSKHAMVNLTTDVSLLTTIIREENEAIIVQAAHQRLQELVEQHA